MTDYDARPKAQAKLSEIRIMKSLALEVDGDRVLRTSLLGSREVWKLLTGRGESAVYVLTPEQRKES